MFTGLSVLLVVLFVFDILTGAADVPLSALWTEGTAHNIIFGLRLPKSLTAVLAGVSLSLSGLLMQTLFRNPLAGPSVLGVSGGATLGVAMLVFLGALFGFTVSAWTTVLSAILGATVVLLLAMLVAAGVSDNVTLLIVGMMIGAIAAALVNVLQNFADPDSLKLFITWTLGSLSSVGWQEMRVLVPVILAGATISVGLLKSLNGLQLGEDYAAALGVPVKLVRTLIILSTGLLAGGITAFCGPVSFVGVAIPHLARGLFRTANHHVTLPASALLGADLLLLCDIICYSSTYPLPISTVSALFGAPVVMYVVMRKKS
ncbi:MAG: iron ABC transporter permease [Paludibacteraceae bacterium]|nr:iron ABC transporter permease [Paludibacteraceae bacterium]